MTDGLPIWKKQPVPIVLKDSLPEQVEEETNGEPADPLVHPRHGGR